MFKTRITTTYFITMLLLIACTSTQITSVATSFSSPTIISPTSTSISHPTLTPIQLSTNWETAKQCVTYAQARPANFQLDGTAAVRLLKANTIQLSLSLLNLSNGDAIKIPTSNPVDYASLSPDRTTLAYERFNDSNSKWELVLINAKGVVQKVRLSSEQGFSFQDWLNDHQLLITAQDFQYTVLDAHNNSQMKILPAGFPDFTHLDNSFFVSFDPSFMRAIYKDGDINILDLNTKTIVTHIKDVYDRIPIVAWQPSGERAAIVASAFTGQKSSILPDEIFILDKDGRVGQLTHIYDNFGLVSNIDSLSWSPDEEKIAFWFYDGQANDTLMMADARTGELTNYCILNVIKTNFPIGLPAPIWSPDGKYLMIENRSRADESKLLIVDIQNKVAFPITENASPVGWMIQP